MSQVTPFASPLTVVDEASLPTIKVNTKNFATQTHLESSMEEKILKVFTLAKHVMVVENASNNWGDLDEDKTFEDPSSLSLTWMSTLVCY